VNKEIRVASCMSLAELDLIVSFDSTMWNDLRNSRIFLTGGTGFYGSWLVESFCAIQDRFNLNSRLYILTRNHDGIQKKYQHLISRGDIIFVSGDVRSFQFPDGNFSHIIHAATPASAKLKSSDSLNMITTILDGTKRVLEFARSSGATKFLLTSSGAVYGPQPFEMANIDEGFLGGPNVLADNSSYAEGKRAAECLSAIYNRVYGIDVKIARGFAFVGPHLPLDGTFAVGNFIADGLAGRPIRVGGDGTPYRSYLYATDLAIWLWTILIRGQPLTAYNVGSDEAITIADLARKVGNICGVEVDIAKSAERGAQASRYIPDISRAKNDLGLNVFTSLEDAIRRTIEWNRLKL
jgi:nucleoside-diphosphate-sugar epimerase